MSGYALVEEVMKRKGLSKENQVADALGTDRRILNNMKRRNGKPDAELLLDLMLYGDINADEAKKLLKSEKGEIRLSLLGVTALLCTLGLASFWTIQHCILCQIKWKLAKTQHAGFAGLKRIANLQIA